MELLLKVILGMLIAAGIILGTMTIFLAASGLWSYIQDCIHDEWGFDLPPRKDDWYGEWVRTGELTLDVVPQKVFRCGNCDYKTPIMSRCCPSCGAYMKNWDFEWNTHKKEDDDGC